MDDSILGTIKKMLGIAEGDDAFDTDVVVCINSAIMTANQLGVGEDGFMITGPNETWGSFIGSSPQLEAVKHYIYMCVRIAFDPPTSSSALNSLEKMRDELTWRLNVQAEAGG